MERTLSVPVGHATSGRPPADRLMRRLLRLPDGPPQGSARAAQSTFGRSIVISAVRCLLTYVVIPVLGPVVGATGAVGPVLGLLLSAASVIAIVASTRRFFAVDHRYRWGYAAIGAGIMVLLAVQAVGDVSALAS